MMPLFGRSEVKHITRTKVLPSIKYKPQGSALVFVLVFLVILTALGTAFAIYVRIGSRTTVSAMRNLQAEMNLEAGMQHAMSALHNTYRNKTFFSTDCAFTNIPAWNLPCIQLKENMLDAIGNPNVKRTTRTGDDVELGNYILPGKNGYLDSLIPLDSTDTIVFPNPGVLRLFETYNNEQTIAETMFADPVQTDIDDLFRSDGFAFLWYGSDPLNPDDLHDKYFWVNWADAFDAAGIKLGSIIELMPERFQPLRFSESRLAHGLGLHSYLTIHYPGGPEHLNLARSFKNRITGTAELYDGSQAMLNKNRQIPPIRGEYYIWVADLGAKLPIFVDSINSPERMNIAQAIFESLRKILNDSAKTPLVTATGKTPLGIEDQEVWDARKLFNDLISLDAKAERVRADTDVWQLLKRQDPDQPPNSDEQPGYMVGKALFERQFTVFPLKQQAAEYALNINTATLEHLVAVLAQLPLVEGFEPGKPYPAANHDKNFNKALALAQRIMTKRPFAGLMDFEDFLAAHLEQNIDTELSSSENEQKIAGMIYRAIPKRRYFTRTNNRDFRTPLTEDDLFGDQVQHLDARTLIKNASLQQQRFVWFRDGIVSTTPKDATNDTNPLLTLRAFNELCMHLNRKFIDQNGLERFSYSFYSLDIVPGIGTIDIPAAPPLTVVPADPTLHSLAQYAADYPENELTPKLKYKLIETEGEGYTAALWLNKLEAWYPTNTSGLYAFYAGITDDIQNKLWLKEYDFPAMPPIEEILITGGSALESLCENPTAGAADPLKGDIVAGNNIIDRSDLGGKYIVNSTVHGPLRAYQLAGVDNINRPDCVPYTTDPAACWTLPLCFHSRYYKIFVLARSLDKRIDKRMEKGSDPERDEYISQVVENSPVPGSERRVEFVYDAREDKILSSKRPLTEKRNLGDPSFPEE